MKKRILQVKWTKRIILIALLLAGAGMMNVYANESTASNVSYSIVCDWPIHGNGSGSIAANVTSANAGDLITLTASPSTNCGFISVENWIVTDGNNNSIIVTPDVDDPNRGTFIMPASNVTVTASFFRSFLLFAIFEDYMTSEERVPKREHNTGTFYYDNVESLQLPHYEDLWNKTWYYGGNMYRTDGYIFLAQNEKEGFQLFFREQDKERNLRIEVEPFLNSQGEELQHSVYWEEFFWVENVWGPGEIINDMDSLAEALVPYNGETHKTSVGHNKVFFIELESTKNQTPGYYVSTITAYDGNEVLATRTIHAKIWNFALPENHYSDVVMGLYNCNSSYKGTSSLFRLNGINVDAQGNIAESDLPAAKQILDGYHECLLEHGVSTFEIPRWKMADDPKAAELIMADPRRRVFAVPVNPTDATYFNGSGFTPYAQEVIANYKNLAYDNPFLRDKAYFYLMDEISANEGTEASLSAISNNLATLWPCYHAVVTFNEKNGGYSEKISILEGKTDILCPNQGLFDPYPAGVQSEQYALKQSNFEDFIDRENHPDRFRTWRYEVDGQSGSTQCWISRLAVPGIMRRIVFWQQYRMNSDGWLQWNCAYLPNDWTKKKLYANGEAKVNGDGVLLYPGTMFGQSAETPIVSLRLKQLYAGIEDYDYLRLAKEFLSESAVDDTYELHYLNTTVDCRFLNRLAPYGYYRGYTSIELHRARYKLGERLSAANTEHDWGEWQTAVLPDETHNGLEIRTCSHCGTQESRPKTYSSLYRFVGTENNQWANLNNWANNPETLPAPGEAVVIAHDCEINSNTTQFYVVVNDGFNLTINEGVTLTSQRITTEGNAQVIVEDGAQLKTMSEGVQATVKKSITPHNGTGGWHFVSTSLASDVVPSTSNNIVSSTAGNYDLYLFDQSENLEWRNYKVHGFNLENGKGYLYANSDEDVSLEFAGTTNGNAEKGFGLAYDASAELPGWNLVGNPYPCNVYADKSYYVLDESGSVIEPNTVSSSIAIAPCTGIMVKAETTDETVTFSKTAPETQGQNKGSLQIAVARANTRDNSIQDKAIVSFNAGDELEKFFFNEDNAKLYIPQGNRDFAIACSEKSGEMPLNIKATKDGIYTLSVNPDNVDLDYLHLIDNLTGVDVDLLQTPAYSFVAKTTDYTSRFRLVFFANDASSDPASDAPFAFISNGNIIVFGAEDGAVLQIVDVLGRVLIGRDAARIVSTNEMAQGVYVLRLVEGENVRTQKIAIK